MGSSLKRHTRACCRPGTQGAGLLCKQRAMGATPGSRSRKGSCPSVTWETPTPVHIDHLEPERPTIS